MAYFPDATFTPRETENLPGIVFDPTQKQNLFSEDYQGLGAEIQAIEETLGVDIENVKVLFREKLTANRNYYVRTDGNDSHLGDGNTSGQAFLTIQKAIDTVAGLDCSIYSVNIYVANGTYAGNNLLKSFIGSGLVSIIGNETTRSNVLINSSAYCFYGNSCVGKYYISGMKFVCSSGSGILAFGAPTNITLGKVEYGACNNAHIYCEGFGAFILCQQAYTISGGCNWGHLTSIAGGYIQISGMTVTISGTPAFGFFAWCTRGLGMISAFSCTFTGSATGQRYNIQNNSVCFTNGGSATYLPGNSAGAVSNGGLYV